MSCNEASEAIAGEAGAAAVDQGQQTMIAESGELQDGSDSNSRELEPGELLTPPHQQQSQPLQQQSQGNASPVLKKMLTKDVRNKALRKLTQIDTENGEEKVQTMLELEAIRRKEASVAPPQENGDVSASPTTAAASAPAAGEAEADDSEGLYSDTDSSTDEQKRVEDVQQARKEKQAEAAAAAAAPSQPPVPHHPFLGINPMRFHLRPRFDMPPMGFMHRMPRGGMRGMRPPFYSRPPGQMRCATPRGPTPPFASTPSSACNGQQGPVKTSPDAYGPALPPGQGQGQPKQSELIWTSSKPPLSFIYNLVTDCTNPHHKSCKQREPKEQTKSKDKERQSTETPRDHKQRERWKDKPRERSKERKRDGSKEERRTHSSDKQNDRSKDEKRERSQEKQKKDTSKERPGERTKNRKDADRKRDNSRDAKKKEHSSDVSKPKEHSKERSKHREHSKERSKPREHSKERSKDRSKQRHHSKEKRSFEKSVHSSKGKSQERSKERRSRSIRATTPPAPPPAASLPTVQAKLEEEPQQLTPPRPKTPAETRKAFDIFAESPPRLNKAGNSNLAKAEVLPPERSTTPPLDNRHIPVIAPPPSLTVPLSLPLPDPPKQQLKLHSEIHCRIGALLEDDDLHLEALLATKEQLLRKSHEHRSKKENSKQQQQQQQIKQEPNERRSANPFKRETVLTDVSSRKSLESSRHSMQRERDSKRRSDEYKERNIKQEKQRSRTPPLLTARQIKVERDMTPPLRSRERDVERLEVPVRNGVLAANAPPPATLVGSEHSPDTDDYIDNWENDDSLVGGGDSNTPKNAANMQVTRVNGLDEDEDSNTLWNTNTTPPPKCRAAQTTAPEKPLINIQDVYDKFMKSIKMGAHTAETTTTTSPQAATTTAATTTTTNSSLSTADDESSSDTEDSGSGSSSSASSSSSGSSSDDDDEDEDEEDDSSSEEDEKEGGEASRTLQQQQQQKEEQRQLMDLEDNSQSQSVGGEEPLAAGKQSQSHKKNNVSKDLRKLKNLEDNLARIQMMRNNYDSGDDICEELLKMESLFVMQRTAIMNKYRKPELKAAAGEEGDSQQPERMMQVEPQQPVPASPVNNIFDANREAIKLKWSPFKLSTRKPAIFDKDELETAPQDKPVHPAPFEEKLQRPHKEIAIVKPTIMDTRAKSPPPRSQQHNQLKRSHTRERSRSRSLSRNWFRRNVRPSRSKDPTRSPSPRRRRLPASPPLRRGRFGKPSGRLGTGRSSCSRSMSRSRTRSRSPLRRRRLKPLASRRRNSLSPPGKLMGPRSPPPSRRRSYSRERYSRSPLPFKPPSPPMRRSWSSSRSRSPSRRTRSRSRSRSPHDQNYTDYFVENQSLEAAAYYYNMSLMQHASGGESYDGYGAYMDTYNMEQAYAQYSEYSASGGTVIPAAMDYDYETPRHLEPSSISVLRELPMAPVVPVAVQKGNVLEIVPNAEPIVEHTQTIPPAQPEEQIEDKNKPKRKRVNFVDKVLPTYESDSEDRKIVERAVERAVHQYRERCAAKAAKLQRMREQLLAMPAPPPPITPKPAHLEKAVLVQKKPRFRYYHFDPTKGTIVKSAERVLRSALPVPRFDPKFMAMLVKSGRLPMPAFMRHRQPTEAMLQEFFSKHPPPPLHSVMPHYMRGPPPSASPQPPPPAIAASQPIPVLGAQSYGGFPSITAPSVPVQVPVVVPVTVPVPVPVPVPPPQAAPLQLSLPLPTPSTYFTPPPLPTLPSHFNVQPVPTMREIMPVDILQKIGPLPKTLDLDGGTAGLDSDLTEAETTAAQPAELTIAEVNNPPVTQPQQQLLNT